MTSTSQHYLIETLSGVPEIVELLHILNDVQLPNHFLAGGAVTQAVWNRKLGHSPLHQIKDLDVVYFDKVMSKTEREFQADINALKSHNLPVDVKNQAKVHEWYGAKFGNDIAPLQSVEDGIRMWLSCFAVGVRLVGGAMHVFAPFGLEDQASMLVRPNKTAMSEANYDAMNASFKRRWPSICIEEWS